MAGKTSAGKTSRGWDATSHEDLLLSLIDEFKPSKAIITQVTERMRQRGYTYSYDAVKYSSTNVLSTPSEAIY